MRIPIYTADLSDKRGFKRIAKKLQRNWPSATPLTLASAQTILSRGLGYRDYHDLQQSAEEDDLHAASATPNEARDGISTSIFAFCQASKITGVDQTDLEGLVKVLPLQELRAFQGFIPGHPADLASPTVLDTPIDAGRELPDSSNRISADHPDQPTNAGLNLSHTFTPKKLIDEKGLKVLWEVVQCRGSLRDQSCVAMLLQGLRPHDLMPAKPHDFSYVDSGVLMRVHYAKSRSTEGFALLPGSFGHVVGRYIHKAALSENDFLFPSEKDARVPMSSQQMSRIIGSYLREALNDLAQRSIHRIRQSVIVNIMKASASSVSDIMGHSSPKTTLGYISGLRKKPKK
ncbi:tyrosine-type recombinase/integrase [Pseudomonas sp. SWRI79]|uniref:Tyrosine-type recombinase/integrase n=1 Tax=Pseudomonas farris TaxID=2841207 RepID=A0ABS6Q3T5_9PSED|nr:tyrosine-type recombinase/integrase [Pseudomonas farris]MBV4467377.1 tyrosine-type recombinase/integrase [Pseudomonas farris]